MSSEILKRDQNSEPVIGLVTDDAAKEIRMGRIDDSTKGLKVMFVGGIAMGDVSGPASSTTDDIATYSDTTGKVIKDGGKKISDLVLTTTTVAGHALSSNVDIALDDLSNVIVPTPNLNDLLSWNGANWISASPGSAVGQPVTLWYDPTSSGVSTYLELLTGASASAEQDNSVAVDSGTTPQTIATFITTGVIGTTIIPSGEWGFDSYANVSSNTGTTKLQYIVKARTAGGSETTLFTAQSQTVIGSTTLIYSVDSFQPSFVVNATDKIVVVIQAVATGATPRTLHFIYAGTTHASHFHSPLIMNHNNLAGLQGGSANEYYHLTSNEYQGTGVGTGNMARLNSPVFTTPNIGSATGSISGNAGTVTNATLTTAFTVNGGTLTLSANAANTSALTIPAGANTIAVLAANSFTGLQTYKNQAQTITAMAAQALDGSLGNVFTRTLAASETFTQSNFTTGQFFLVKVKQGSGTSYTVTWFATVTWITPGATAPVQTVTTNGYTTYGFMCTGSNTFDGYLVSSQ